MYQPQCLATGSKNGTLQSLHLYCPLERLQHIPCYTTTILIRHNYYSLLTYLFLYNQCEQVVSDEKKIEYCIQYTNIERMKKIMMHRS